MDWLDFLIGCCAGSIFGIIFCSVQDIMGKRDIDRAVRKEKIDPIKLTITKKPKKHMTWCETCKGVAWCYENGVIMCDKCGLTVKNAKIQHEKLLVTFCEHCKHDKTNEHNERK